MKNTPFSPTCRVRLALLAAFLCVFISFSPSLYSNSLRSHSKPNATLEDSVEFTGEDDLSSSAKDVQIKEHSHGSESEGSEREPGESQKEEGEEGKGAEAPEEEDEQGKASESEAETDEGRQSKTAASGTEQTPEDVTSSTGKTSPEVSVAHQEPNASSGESAAAAEQQTDAESAAEPPAGSSSESAAAGAGEAGPPETSRLREIQRITTETKLEVVEEAKKTSGEEAQGDTTRHAVNERLKALGAPFTLGKEHFSVNFKHGFKLGASEFEALAAKKQGVLWRAVSEEPQMASEKTLFLVIDLDDKFIGTDVRLVQLFVKAEACSVEAEGACKIQWFLREPSPASPPHRIVLMGFSSPTGEKFEFDDLLKKIQQKPTDVDLRRISLPRFFEDHAKFFKDQQGNFAATPSWHVFAMVSQGAGESETHVDNPLLELPANATAAEKEEVMRVAKEANEEVDGLSTPQHGGESPGAGGHVDASTIFKYVLGSLLLIGLFVGIAVSVCSCAKSKVDS